MRLALPRSQDFWAGLLFIAFGAVALWIGQDYTFGTARRMGPGYFPSLLGGILCVLGLIIAGRGLVRGGAEVPRGAVRPFLILVGILAFALLLQPGGLVLATLALIVISSAGGSEFKLKEVLITSAVLIVTAVVVFAWGLGLQFSIWPHWG
jgi:Tripartite tricarboxylate transporter TctB family